MFLHSNSSSGRTPKRSMKMVVLLLTLFSNIIIFAAQPTAALRISYNNYEDDEDNYQSKGIQSYFGTSTQLQVKKAAQRRNEKLRQSVKALLFTNGCMMLKGNLAVQSLLISMIATKVIHKTTEDEMKNISWIFLSWSSVFFSGTASIFRWLINHLKKIYQSPEEQVYVNTAASQPRTDSVILLLGSRGMELIGGTFVLFCLFLSL